MKYFLDTNIILDFLIDSRKNFVSVRLLIEEIRKRDLKSEFWIDRDSISTINYLLRKETLKNEITKTIIMSFNIASNTDILVNSINIASNENLDYEDVVKVKTAEEIKAVFFITEDKKLLHYKKFKISVFNIEDILMKFGYEKNLLGKYENKKQEAIQEAKKKLLELQDFIKQNEDFEIPDDDLGGEIDVSTSVSYGNLDEAMKIIEEDILKNEKK